MDLDRLAHRRYVHEYGRQVDVAHQKADEVVADGLVTPEEGVPCPVVAVAVQEPPVDLPLREDTPPPSSQETGAPGGPKTPCPVPTDKRGFPSQTPQVFTVTLYKQVSYLFDYGLRGAVNQ